MGLYVFGSEVGLALMGVEGDKGGREKGEAEEGRECKRGIDEKLSEKITCSFYHIR